LQREGLQEFKHVFISKSAFPSYNNNDQNQS
jgi:hypothetical protein